MKIKFFLAVFVALAMGGCESESGDEAMNDDESARLREPEFAGEGSRERLVISPRTYTSGTVTAKVTGFFEVDGSQLLNVPASISDDEQTWLQYGVSGGPGLDVLFTNSQSMAEHGVMIGMGSYSVTSTSGECRTQQVDVTPTLVTGRYSCSGATGYNSQTGQMGEVDVEVEFKAGS